MSGPALELAAAERHYRTAGGLVKAVNGVDLRVETGECVAVMGPSGSGKSTLLSLAGGLERPSAGSVTVLGTDIGVLSDEARATFRREHIGFVFQALGLLPFLTAAENVAFGVGVADTDDALDAHETLASLGLAARADRLPDQLSGGERERVAIARCLAHRPALVLGDEPTGSLDAASSEQAIRFLSSAVRELAATAVVVTHDPSVAAVFDRVVKLSDGKVVEEGNTPGGERDGARVHG
jgi:putative ABC transport system ATP-binding protein